MRYEKQLLARPMPPCPDLLQRENEKIDEYHTKVFRRYAAELAEIAGEKVLGVTTYTEKGEPKYRFWSVGDQRGLEVVNNEYCGANLREHGKMYGASIDSCYTEISSHWTSRDLVFYSTDKDADRILEFLGAKAPREEAFKLLVKKQKKDREEIITRRDEKKREQLRQAFAGIPREASVEFKCWCEDVAMKHLRYFFYDYTGRKEQSGVCSYCGHRSSLPGIYHGKKGICPACNSPVMFYSAKRFQRGHGLSGRVNAAQCALMEDKIVVRCFTVGIVLQGSKYPDRVYEKLIWAREDMRSFLDPVSGLETARYATPEGTKKVYVDGLCRVDTVGYSIEEHALMPTGVDEICRRLGIYAPLAELARRGREVDPVSVWQLVKKKREVEYLIKLGFYRLAENELKTRRVQAKILLEGKSAAEILGVPAETVQVLRRIDPGAYMLKMIRQLLKCGDVLTEQDMRELDRLSIESGYAKMLHRMMGYATPHKVLRYISVQAERSKRNASHVVQQWGDYMGMAEEIGKNTQSLQVIFPKDLKTAHDEAAKLQHLKKNKELSKKIGETAEKLQEFCWTWNGLTIRPAESHEELFAEGEALNHCVGRMHYAEKMAEGQTAIFFIRKATEPDKPYVTLELNLKTWEKIQCYGRSDTWAGTAIDNFVKKWISDVVKPAAKDRPAKTA